MTHFTYEDRSQTADLHQGDILQRTDELTAVLNAVFPHFADERSYPMFMVLTQSCDLVRRANNRCKSHYVTICAVRDFFDAVNREVGELGKSNLGKHGLLPASRRTRAHQIIERFYNNTQPEYFYLHPDAAIPKPLCAFLALPIALQAQKHYEVCLAARVCGLNSEFRAKVGWLIGDIYARVATEDWQSQPNFNEREFNLEIEKLLEQRFLWLDEAGERKVKRAVKEGNLNLEDRDAVNDFVSGLPKQRDEVAAIIKAEMMKVAGEKMTDQLADTLTNRLLERKVVKDRFLSTGSLDEDMS
ncbi:MAG: hypothetical protein ACYC6A_15165 [Armatimonadota bacterium]